MKYKIIKNTSKELDIIKGNINNIVKVKTSITYSAKRKGKVFGFWHTVGHEYDWDGILNPYITKTVEEMEDYIRKFHEVKYSKYPIEIIKEINI